jgi:hypothetical protein
MIEVSDKKRCVHHRVTSLLLYLASLMTHDLISSDTSLRSIKLGDTGMRISDGNGLSLLLFVKVGLHSWRFDYTFLGVEKCYRSALIRTPA